MLLGYEMMLDMIDGNTICITGFCIVGSALVGEFSQGSHSSPVNMTTL